MKIEFTAFAVKPAGLGGEVKGAMPGGRPAQQDLVSDAFRPFPLEHGIAYAHVSPVDTGVVFPFHHSEHAAGRAQGMGPVAGFVVPVAVVSPRIGNETSPAHDFHQGTNHPLE